MSEKKESSNWIQTLINGGWRSVVFGLMFMGIIVGIIEYTFQRLSSLANEGNLEMEVNSSGSLVWRSANKNAESVFNLPTSAGWVNSGITLEPDESLLIRAAGRACFSIHQLVESSNKGEQSPFQWIDPAGISWSSDDATAMKDKMEGVKKEQLISPNHQFGALLCCLVQNGSAQPDLHTNATPPEIVYIGTHGRVKNTSGASVQLWFIANDIVNQDGTKEASSRYWQDNVGSYWILCSGVK